MNCGVDCYIKKRTVCAAVAGDTRFRSFTRACCDGVRTICEFSRFGKIADTVP